MIGKISLGTEKYLFSYDKNSQHTSYKRDFFNLIKRYSQNTIWLTLYVTTKH